MGVDQQNLIVHAHVRQELWDRPTVPQRLGEAVNTIGGAVIEHLLVQPVARILAFGGAAVHHTRKVV